MKTLSVIVVLLISGCALTPDTAQLALTHISQPGRGVGPSPMGNDGLSPETTMELAEITARWEHGHAFAETSMGYVLHETWFTGGPWVFTARTGIKFRIEP